MKRLPRPDTPVGTRLPAVAGLFYPDNPVTLAREIDQMFARATLKPLQGSIVALIAPHAGYQYSGPTASIAYKHLQGTDYDTVVVVAPSHREYFDGISVFDGVSYVTPLGELAVDERLRSELTMNDPFIRSSSAGHRQEHAIEVQLPFVQKVVQNATILPIVVGDQRRDYCLHLGDRLGTLLRGKHAILVASTDLSHYHPYDEANALDHRAIDIVQRFDYEQLMTELETEGIEACGGGPTVAVLAAARALGGNHVEILHHCNSGDVTGDRSNVVGYFSAAVLRRN